MNITKLRKLSITKVYVNFGLAEWQSKSDVLLAIPTYSCCSQGVRVLGDHILAQARVQATYQPQD